MGGARSAGCGVGRDDPVRVSSGRVGGGRVWRGRQGRPSGAVRAPDDRGDHFDDPARPAGTPTRAPPSSPAGRTRCRARGSADPGRTPPPRPVPGGLAHPRTPPGRPRPFRERVGFQSNAQTGGARSTRNLRARGRMTGRGRRTGRRTRPPRRPHPGRLFWGVRVGLVGLLGRPGAESCPNLPQRHPGPG